MSRIVHLDYLRGLAALAVLLFHFEKWGAEQWNADTFLGKCGVYAVSVFFVLSGLTLTLVYKNKESGGAGAWFSFGIKRIFRIFPLFWLATAATIFLDETPYPSGRILLNFSGLFGFFDPAGDIALGGWSIGDELVYYTAFPFLLWAGVRRPWLFHLALAGALAIACWYAFCRANTEQTIVAQWPVYVEPLNHAFFFTSGMALGLWHDRLSMLSPAFWKRTLALCLLLFVFYTPGHDPASLLTGVHRIVLSLLVIGLVAAWYKSKPRFSPWPDHALRWLGEVSYSLYLLHPLAYRCLKALDARFWGGTQEWLFISALSATLIVSHLSYRFLEKPMIRFSKQLTKTAAPSDGFSP